MVYKYNHRPNYLTNKSLLIFLVITYTVSVSLAAKADNGYRLWLKYNKIENVDYLKSCRNTINSFNVSRQSSEVPGGRWYVKTTD